MTKQPQKAEGEEKGKQEEKEEEELDDNEAGNIKKNTKPMTIKKRMMKQKDSNNDNNSIDWLFSRTLYPLSFPRHWFIYFLLSQPLHHMLIYSCANAHFYCTFICMNELYTMHGQRFASRKNCT